jgi:hypothetical protein
VFVGTIGKISIDAGCKTLLRKINAQIVLKGSTSGEHIEKFVDGHRHKTGRRTEIPLATNILSFYRALYG